MFLKTDERIRGRRLQARRMAYFQDNPLCKHCQAKGKVREARQLDHIIPLDKGGSEDDPANWQGLCVECHRIKSLRDMNSNKLEYGAGRPNW